jgi:hypothetical protein
MPNVCPSTEYLFHFGMQTVLQMGPMANPEYHEAKAVKSTITVF